MSVLFKSIRWKNFLSTGNIFTEIDLSATGTTLIMGENGSGKSTILDAITFSLFGKPFRNINKPQLVNSIIRKDTIVEVEFIIGKTEYKIVRGIKPAIFEVYVNGSMINQNAEMRDYQEFLERNILKINYKSFCQVVILGSASFVPFMQLPAAQRRNIIEDLLDLQVFTTMNTILKEKIQINTKNIQDKINEQNLIKTKITMVKDHINEMNNKNIQFIREKKTTLLDLKEKINQTENECTSIKNEITEKENGIEDGNAFKTKLSKLNSHKIQMELKIQNFNKNIDFFQNHDNCPTCTQKISKEFSCETIDQNLEEIVKIKDGLDKLAEIYEKTQNNLTVILEKQKEIDQLKHNLSHEKLRLKMYNDQAKSIQNEIDNAKNDIPKTTDIKIVDLENELTILSNEYNELQDNKLVLSAAATMLKDGGIKTKIVNQYIPIINRTINKYLGEFDLFVEFELDEQFNEVIRSRYRDEFSYSSFSEGEKQKIDLAILFTWRTIAKLRNSLNTNLLILDEIFDSSLDGNAADDLLKILQTISGNSNVFVISHRENLHDKFESVIKFEKHKNFSSIQETL
jgi:DNA repair exonuclease SbcCD ATPase subunit